MGDWIFVSFKNKGVPEEILEEELGVVKNVIEWLWKELFCAFYRKDFFNRQWYSNKDKFDFCIEELNLYDTVLFFLNHEEPSEGMLEYELRDAKKLWKNMILFAQEDLLHLEKFKILKESVERIKTFRDLSDLKNVLKEWLPPYLDNIQKNNG